MVKLKYSKFTKLINKKFHKLIFKVLVENVNLKSLNVVSVEHHKVKSHVVLFGDAKKSVAN